MKKPNRNRYLLFALFFMLLSSNLWGQEIPVVRVAAFNYYPAIFLDSDNEVRGFYVDMLNEVATRQKIRFDYVFGSWSEGLERLRAGEVDLVTSVAYTEEGTAFMEFGDQVLLTVWGELYIPQDEPTISIAAFQDQPIAIMRGDYNAQSFKEHLAKFGVSCQFIEFADFDQVLTAIKKKQVVGGVVNSVFGDAAAKQYELHSSGIAFNPFNIYFAAAKGHNAELLNLLDDYLLDWRNDNASVYYQARLKWGPGQEPEEVIPVWVVKLATVAALVLLSGLVFIVLLRHRVNRATHELQKSNNMIRLLLDSTAEGIYGLDPQGICTFCNAACARILGYDSTDQILGHNIHDLIHHSHANGTKIPTTECQLLKDLDKKIHCDSERFWHADGSSFPVEYWSYPIRQEGKAIGLVVSFLDITERKKAQLALQQKNREMEHFIYSVSHDLKSPLVTVITFAGMLRHDLLEADQQQINEDLDYIDKAANKMQQLLDALLQYSRIGRIDAPVQPLQVSRLVDDCLSALAGILPKHQVQVSTSNLTRQLHGDPLHFSQIWQNLIENAVKYSGHQTQLHIEIGATQQGQDVVFYVGDNGMGIAPEHKERIFNLFSQLNPHSDGSGLGLALVKKIVTMYQGRIWVESAGEGKGSCFMFTLPDALSS